MLFIGVKCNNCHKIGATEDGTVWAMEPAEFDAKIGRLVKQLTDKQWTQTNLGNDFCPECMQNLVLGGTVTKITEKIKWVTLASSIVGNEYGHVPGHDYYDVTVKIEQLGEKFRVKVKYVWGSAQGYDEEHGRHEIVALEDSLNAVVTSAIVQGRALDMPAEYLLPALTQAQSDAYDALMGVEKS